MMQLSRALGCIALLFAAFACAAATEPEIPKTPAGAALAGWLEAINSGDPGRIRAFEERNLAFKPQGDTAGLARMSGGFTLLRIESSEPAALVAILGEKKSDTVALANLRMTAGDPPRIASFALNVIPRPASLALERLSLDEAVVNVVKRADEAAARDDFAGALLIARQGKILVNRGWGQARRQPGDVLGNPNTPETQFRLGSMNKMFTAIAVLQLVEAGKIKLADPIGKHLRDYPNKELASRVTVRHLLTHSGATGDIFGPDFDANRLTLKQHSDYLKLYGARALRGEPGKEFAYSNYGFILLGALIERVSGMSYYDYVRQRVFLPAGMTATDSLPESENVPGRATGYMRPPPFQAKAEKWISADRMLPWRGTAAGGGYSTVGDLLRFAEALTGGKLVSKTLLEEATRPQMGQYGYGFMTRGDGDLRHFGHGGGFPGMNTDFRIYPQSGYIVIALSNLDPPGAQQLVEFFTARMPAAVPSAKQVAPKVLADYVGTYRIASGLKLAFSVADGQPMIQAAGQQKLRAFAKSETEFFLEIVDAQFQFFRDAKGRVTHMVFRQDGVEEKALRQ